jgi:hypothetical protein
MALVRVKAFTVPSGSTTAIAIDASDVFGSAVPKLLLLFGNGQNTDGDARFDALRCIGWATSTTARGCCADFSDDAVAANASARHQILTAIASEVTAAETSTGLLDVQSFDAGGVTLVPDDAFTTARTYGIVLIGGDDWEQFTPIRISPTATGNVDYPVTGFIADDPDQGFFAVSAGISNDPASFLVDSTWMFGCAYGGPTPANYVSTGAANDAAATMQSVRFSREGQSLFCWDGAKTAVDCMGAATAWLTDTIRINWANAATTTRDFFLIPFRCANFHLFEFLTSTGTGALTPLTGFGFAPAMVGCFSTCNAENSGTTVSAHDRMCAGFLDAEGSLAAIATNDEDNVADSEIRCYLDADGSNGDIYNAIDTSGKYAGLSVALDADGLTPTQTDADTGASFVWGFAIGGGSSMPPPRRYFQHLLVR